MQFSSQNHPVLILVIACLLMFGMLYATLVRRLSNAKVEGQTAYLVVVGVGATLIGAIAVVGLENALLMFACFAASGLPMVIEYVSRKHKEQKRDREQAQQTARDLLQ